MNEILGLAAVRQAELIREGEISSTELVKAHIRRIEEVNPKLNAVVDLMAEQAYPPKRPNMAHFDPPKKIKPGQDPRTRLTQASVDKLKKNVKRKR